MFCASRDVYVTVALNCILKAFMKFVKEEPLCGFMLNEEETKEYSVICGQMLKLFQIIFCLLGTFCSCSHCYIGFESATQLWQTHWLCS